ncbi:MAG TPA: hypothetical protein VN758_12045 [Solirubrobacterales bacterium]|nr:hypothetical protein [Solirubrobacterales bacterium]
MTTRRSGETTWCYDEARKIRDAERDQALKLDTVCWPQEAPEGWLRGEDHLFRYIRSCPESERSGEAPAQKGQLAVSLRESLHRFPSAPIRGVQRFHEYHNTPPAAENLHTYRVLTSCTPPKRIGRIFLFHNGLNELDRMGLYYQLASEIIASHSADPDAEEKEGVACILRPFPGHLTRAPFAEFAEEPLHRYLWDGSYLYSQFLRYMIETQWFLSAIVKRSRYRSPSGAELLLEEEDPENSRLDTKLLSEEVSEKWRDLRQASVDAVKATKKEGSKVQGLKPEPSDPALLFGETIASLRDVLKLDEWKDLGGALDRDGYEEEPTLHVVGYSLGGFTAQSVFMSWPFVISSCATLLSGGALRELSPTAFAHPEEWQTVLHSLRYELDEGMLDDRFETSSKMVDGENRETVAGLDRELYHYLQRTFYEVFQQEYRGSYESRVEAFRQRLLFVVGGDDPIVRPDSVLDSAPSGGMNLLEIGGLGHFLGNDPKGIEETQQRRFWLPEVGGLIGRFSIEAAERHLAERAGNWLNGDLEVTADATDEKPLAGVEGADREEESRSTTVKLMSDRERLELPGDGALASTNFGACLNDLLARQEPDFEGKGHLFVLRNEIPTLLLPPRAVQRRARALYHDDRRIVKYCREVNSRAEAFGAMERSSLVLPWNAHDIMKLLDPSHRFPSQAEAAVGQIAEEITVDKVWPRCKETLAALEQKRPGSIRIFDGRNPLQDYAGLGERATQLIEAMRESSESTPYVPSLPDCWLWVTPEFLGRKDPTPAEEREALIANAQEFGGDNVKSLAEALRDDHVRAITVSRARYNPRFRGKLVLNARALQQVLTHVALCLAVSHPYPEFDLEDCKLKD